jgi:hypothetical protein
MALEFQLVFLSQCWQFTCAILCKARSFIFINTLFVLWYGEPSPTPILFADEFNTGKLVFRLSVLLTGITFCQFKLLFKFLSTQPSRRSSQFQSISQLPLSRIRKQTFRGGQVLPQSTRLSFPQGCPELLQLAPLFESRRWLGYSCE